MATTPLPTTRFAPPRIDVPIGRTESGELVRLDASWMRAYMMPLVERVGGDTAPSNVVLGDAQNQVLADVSELQTEVVDLELTTVRKDALGGDISIENLKEISLASHIHTAGYTVLWATASATGARCNNLHGIPNPEFYQRVGGVVTVRCSVFDGVDIDRYVKVAFAKRSELTAHLIVTGYRQIDPTTTEITGVELYTTTRADIALGSVTDNTGLVHDLQSAPNTHPQITFLNTMVDGALDVYNMGISGSNTLDWQGADLRAYIESMPYFDIACVDFGYGNDLTDAAGFGYPDGAADIVARLDDSINWVKKRARKVIFMGAEGARPGGDALPADPDYVATPYLSADFTQLQLVNTYLRAYLQTRHPTVEYVDGETAFMRAGTYGSIDTDEIVRGIPPAEFLDNKGVHRTPTGGLVTATGIGEVLMRSVNPYVPLMSNRWDFVYGNTAADLNGLKNQNALYGWFGNVPTIPVLVFGLVFVGTGVEGTSAYGSGFTANMSGRLSMGLNRRGGREMRLVFRDPVDGGANFTLEYRGTSAYPLLTMMNDPQWQGVDLDLIGDFGFGGMKQDSVFRITFGLFATDTFSGTEKMIAAWYSDDGIQTMLGGQRAWVHGWSGIHRAGNGRIRIPRRTYTDACIRFQFTGTPVPGFPMGTFRARLSEFQIRRRQLLAAPLPSSWS